MIEHGCSPTRATLSASASSIVSTLKPFAADTGAGTVLRGIGSWCGEKAVPVVFLHGFLDNCYSFLGLLACLPDFNSYAVDLPGHGRSDHADAAAVHYAPDDFVRQVQGYIERHHSRPVVLVGHSMGAAIACNLAAQAPRLVQGLVLLDQLAPVSCSRASRLFERLKRLLWCGGLHPAIYPSRAAAIEGRARQGGGLVVATHLALRGLDSVAGGYRWSYDPKLLVPTDRYRTEGEVVAMLRNLQQPVLFLESPGDHAKEKARQRAEYLPLLRDVRHEVLAGGHHFHVEQPRATAQAIRAFLSEIGLVSADSRGDAVGPSGAGS